MAIKATISYDIDGFTGGNPATPECRAVFDQFELDGKILDFYRSRTGTLETIEFLFSDSEAYTAYLAEMDLINVFEPAANISDVSPWAAAPATDSDLAYFSAVGPVGANISAASFSPGVIQNQYGSYIDEDTNLAAAFVPGTTTLKSPVVFNEASVPTVGSWQYTGYFIPQRSGFVTFELTSDDMSMLWLRDEADNPTNINALVDNGETHGTQTVSAGLFLDAGVKYQLRILYGNAGGAGQFIAKHDGDVDAVLKTDWSNVTAHHTDFDDFGIAT